MWPTPRPWQRLADKVFSTYGTVDLLINNAGVFQGGLSWERSVADWEWTLGVNVYGIIHAIRSFVPRMIAQGTEGHVVNTASVAAFVTGPYSSPYIVSKCAALSLTECLAHDLAAVESQIGASVLTPSAFDTGIAHTGRVRPDRYGTDGTADGQMTVDALAAITAEGAAPAEAVRPVIDARPQRAVPDPNQTQLHGPTRKPLRRAPGPAPAPTDRRRLSVHGRWTGQGARRATRPPTTPAVPPRHDVSVLFPRN